MCHVQFCTQLHVEGNIPEHRVYMSGTVDCQVDKIGQKSHLCGRIGIVKEILSNKK